jgi:hypothetical protein
MRSVHPADEVTEEARAGWPARSRATACGSRCSREDIFRFGSAALALAAILAATPLAAQTPLASLYDKYQFDLSATTVILNANIRIDANDVPGEGTEVDAEDDLGLPKTRFQPRGSFRWRPWHSHEFEAGYQFARRDGERLLERDINFGDNTYEAGLQVDTELNTDNLFLNYRWALIAKERSQYGVAVGLGVIFLDVGIDATANVNESEGNVEGTKSFKAPVGSLGLYGRWLAGDRWFFQADARYIQVSISRLDAKVAEAGGSARYFIKRWVGVELGYALSAVELDIGPRTRKTGESGIFSGRVEYSLQSARFGVVFVPWAS